MRGGLFGIILYNMMNLVKYLSVCGAASRRRAEARIRAGSVAVDGVVETDPARKLAGNESVTLDGRELRVPERRHYILLHKPRGYVCSNSDAHAEHLALELIDLPGVRLVSAGRLDKESEGAIVFSDDGEFVNRLAHPRYDVRKTYRVAVRPQLTPADRERICSGIVDAGETLRALAVRELADGEYEFVLNAGRKREIRRLVRACGAAVTRLVRTQIGPVTLAGLASGRWRELAPAEVAGLLGKEAGS